MASESFIFPASFAQRQLWFLDQLDPGSPLYNLPQALRLSGPLNVEALQQGLDALVARHESLRTTFAADQGSPLQVIAERAGPVVLPIADLTDLGDADREAQTQRLIIAEARRPFDLTSGPLFRADLLRLKDEEHVLLVTMHHSI